MALDLLPCFWKSLKGEPLTISDLQEADFLIYSFTQKLLEVNPSLVCVCVLSAHFHIPQAKDEASFGELVCGVNHSLEEGSLQQRHQGLVFTHRTLAGLEEDLCEGGRDRPVRWV